MRGKNLWDSIFGLLRLQALVKNLILIRSGILYHNLKRPRGRRRNEASLSANVPRSPVNFILETGAVIPCISSIQGHDDSDAAL